MIEERLAFASNVIHKTKKYVKYQHTLITSI